MPIKLLKIIKNNIAYILIAVLIFAVSRCFSIELPSESVSISVDGKVFINNTL